MYRTYRVALLKYSEVLVLRIHWSCPCLPSENYSAVAPLILCKRLALSVGGVSLGQR